jgi:hypothetical protein
MKHVMDVLSLRARHAMMDVIETTEVTEIPHVMEGFTINSSPYGNMEVRLYA